MFAILKIILGVCGAGLAISCASATPSPCTPVALASIEAEFAAELIAACPDKATRNQCAVVPALRAERAQKEKDLQCH